MKKICYRLHPGDYAIGENEAFYGKMERKGWRLERRGVYLSRFRRTVTEDASEDSKCVQYRIELSTPGFLEEADLPEEQVAVYEDCGWELVTSYQLVHVFRTTGDQSFPAAEFYDRPEQQAKTLKALRRNYLIFFVWMFVILGLYFIMGAAVSGSLSDVGLEYVMKLKRIWIEDTALFLAFLTLLLSSLYDSAYGGIRTGLLYCRLKQGIPLDHEPKKKHYLHKTICSCFGALLVAFSLLAAAQYLNADRYDMPLVSEGDYLLLSDLGWQGERSHLISEDKTSQVKRSRSLLAEQIHTFECIREGETDYWLYQDIYILRRKKDVESLTEMLKNTGLFVSNPEDFRPVEMEGLDAAYVGRMEYIAVRGNRVARLIYSDPGVYGPEGKAKMDVLQALAELWGEQH